jgi:uncharacterized phage protein (TIGR02218 family)
MSYDSLSSGAETSKPIELYTISVGGTVYYYTSAEDEITIGADTWEPLAIEREVITAEAKEREGAELKITMPATTAVAREYINTVPGVITTIEIQRVERDDIGATDTKVKIFEGVLSSVSFENDAEIASVHCRGQVDQAGRPMPRYTYQGLCNHVLYDARCGIVESSFKFTGEVIAVSGNTITVEGADAQADGYYNSGFVEFASNDHRLILDHTGEVLTLVLPFAQSPLGQQVDLFAGCDHTISVCKSKFNNVENYGGFAFVPILNPFNGLKQ